MEAQELLEHASVHTYPAGDVVFRQGDDPDEGFYFVVNGQAGVFRDNYYDGKMPIIQVPPGGTFGEMGLLLDRPRSGTVKALGEDLKVVSITKDLFVNEIHHNVPFLSGLLRATIRRMLHLREIEQMENYKVSWDLPDHICRVIERNREDNLGLKDYLNNMRNLSIGPNHAIFHQGSKTDNMIYFVMQGEVGIFNDHDNSLEPVGVRLPGDIFGYMHLVDEPVRTYTARSLERNAMLIFLDRDLFFKIIRIYPEFGFLIYKTLLTQTLTFQYNLLRAHNKEDGLA